MLATLLLPAMAFASTTLVQSASNSTAGGTSVTVTISATAANDLLVLAFADTGANVPTLVQTNTGVALTSAVSISTGVGLEALYYLPNVAAGVTSVTATFTFDVAAAALMEYSGIAASSPLDKTSSKDNGFSPGTTAWDSNNTAALTATNELVVGAAFQFRSVVGTETFIAGSGYSGILTVNSSLFVENILSVSGTAAQNANGTVSINLNSQTYGVTATFLSAAVAPNIKLKGSVKLKGSIKLK